MTSKLSQDYITISLVLSTSTWFILLKESFFLATLNFFLPFVLYAFFSQVMGLMLGKVDGPTMIVMDSFALPVEGTETRVNAQAQAYEYMTAYVEAAKQVCLVVWLDYFIAEFFVRSIIVNCACNYVTHGF